MLRKTFNRGRASVPLTVARMRRWRLARAVRVCGTILTMLLLPLAGLAGLAGLAPDALTRIGDALALVRFRLADAADLGRFLAHELLVNAGDMDARGAFDVEGDARRRR